MSFVPTQEQEKATLMAMRGETMKLIAFAGTGKTATLKLIADILNKQEKRGLYLAFNRSIAIEAERKMPPNVECRTFHSLALSKAPEHIKSRLNKEFPIWSFENEFQVTKIIIEVAETANDEKALKHGKVKKIILGVNSEIISVSKQKKITDNALSYFMRSDSDELSKDFVKRAILVEYEEILPDSLEVLVEQLHKIAVKLWNDFTSEKGVFGLKGKHDVYLKLWAMDDPKITADFILFDEAQDADPIMTQILSKQKCQVIYVGDPFQQIYGWRGAVNVLQDLTVQESYLTQSFRFGQEIAKVCQPLLDYLGSEKKISGSKNIPTKVDYTNKDPSDFDVVLCRSNAGAIQACLEYQEKGVMVLPVNIDFKDTEHMLMSIHELKTKGQTDHKTLSGFQSYDALEEYAKSIPNDMSISSYVKLYRKFDMNNILALIEHCNKATNGLVANDTIKIATTAHKAKGLEWDGVLLHEDFLMCFLDSDGKAKESILDEEVRLLYVALTRAKLSLYVGRVYAALAGF